MSNGGKGSKQRPLSDRKKFGDNFEAIFGKKKGRRRDNKPVES